MTGIRSDCQKRKQARNNRRMDFGKPDFTRFPNAGSIDFEKIFGTPTLAKTITMLIRLQRIKRVRGAGTAKELWPVVMGLPSHVDIRPGRRFHHLTPTCREGMPYHGNDVSNLLLYKKDREEALHRRFGSRTLEEIIILLLWLHKTGRCLCGLLCHWYERSCGKQIGRRANFLARFRENLDHFKPQPRRPGPFYCHVPSGDRLLKALY